MKSKANKQIQSVKIQSIEIKIGDKNIRLTVEQAKELKEILSEMYGGPALFPYPMPVPYPIYERPWTQWDYHYTDNTVTLTSGDKP